MKSTATEETLLRVLETLEMIASNGMVPGDDVYWTGKHRFGKAVSADLGADLDSTGVNSTISPLVGMHHVTGTGSVQTIGLPYLGFTGTIVLIPDDLFTMVTGGNIALGVTAVVGQALHMTYDGTAWYPSYIA